MTELQVFKRNKGILVDIDESNSSQFHTLYRPYLVPSELNPIDPTFNGFLQDLRITISIKSLDEVGFPDLEPELSRAERLVAYTAIEWRNPRFELAIFESLDGNEWSEISRLSLQNRSPYYSIDLLPYFTKQADAILGEKWIGVQVQDVGWGLLTGNDRLCIFGSMQLQAHHFVGTGASSLLPTPAVLARNFTFTVGQQSMELIEANPHRKGFVATLATPGSVFLSMGEPAEINKGVNMNGRGSVFILDFNLLWLNEVYCLTPNTEEIILSCVEFI